MSNLKHMSQHTTEAAHNYSQKNKKNLDQVKNDRIKKI